MGNSKGFVWMHSIINVVWTFWLVVLVGTSFSLRLCAAQIGQENEQFNWAEVKKAYDAFLNYPDDKNGMILSGKLPTSAYVFSDERLWKEVLDYMIEDWDNYQALEYEALSGNYYAAEVIYRMTNIADGDAAETLCESLAKLIRINPRNFLRLFYENGWDDDRRLSSIFSMPSYSSSNFDNSMRIRALRSVAEPRYDYLKKKFISIIQEMMKNEQKL